MVFAVVLASLTCSSMLFVSSYRLATQSLCSNQAPSVVEITLPPLTVPVRPKPLRAAETVKAVEPVEAPMAVAHDPSEAALMLFKLTPKVKECATQAKIKEKSARLRVRIAQDGRLESAVTASGNSEFQQCLLEEARQLQFPTLSEAADLSYSFRL